jgi:hypothetical protein
VEQKELFTPLNKYVTDNVTDNVIDHILYLSRRFVNKIFWIISKTPKSTNLTAYSSLIYGGFTFYFPADLYKQGTCGVVVDWQWAVPLIFDL